MEFPWGTVLEDDALFWLSHGIREEDGDFSIVFEPQVCEERREAGGVWIFCSGRWVVGQDVEQHDFCDGFFAFELDGIWVTMFKRYI